MDKNYIVAGYKDFALINEAVTRKMDKIIAEWDSGENDDDDDELFLEWHMLNSFREQNIIEWETMSERLIKIGQDMHEHAMEALSEHDKDMRESTLNN